MHKDATDPRYIWRQMQESNAHRTAGDKRFLAVINVIFGLVILSFVFSFVTNNSLWLDLVTAVLVVTVVAYLGWRVWGSSRALQAKAAAGIQSAPLTPRSTAGCIIYGMGIGLMVSDLVIGKIFLPQQDFIWVILLLPLAWLPGLLCAALWLLLNRPHRL